MGRSARAAVIGRGRRPRSARRAAPSWPTRRCRACQTGVLGVRAAPPRATRRPCRRRRHERGAGLGRGQRVLVVRRGPARARRLRPRPAPTSSRSGARPRARSSSTTSPCRAGTPSSPPADGGWVVRDVGSLNGTYVNRERIDERRPGRRRRGADRQVPLRLPAAGGRPVVTSREHRGRRRARAAWASARCSHAAPGLPRRDDLQDPLPRVRGPGRARSAPRRATASSATPTSSGCATCSACQRDQYLPLQGDPRAPRRHRPRASSRRAGGRGPAASRAALVAADGMPARRVVPAGAGRELRLSRAELLEASGLDEVAARAARVARPGGAQRGRPLRRRCAVVVGHDRRRDGRVRHRAAAPARVQDRRRPRGRAGASRWSRRCCASADPEAPGSGPRRRSASWRRCRCGCTPRW